MELFAQQALLPGGWAQDVLLSVTADGNIADVRVGVPANGAPRLPGPLLPGMPNLHSHAFQRAMAGAAEVANNSQDSFWTWRRRMYDLVSRVTPEQMEVITAYVYIEMLKAGYTSVAEFHYLHHDPNGHPYTNVAETSERVMAAAAETGIAQTLLPVLYRYSGFGAQAPDTGQRRFLHDTDDYTQLWQTLHSRIRERPHQSLGLCFHSLRAVAPEQFDPVLSLNVQVPVHIHIAEQQPEVDACLQWSGQRPVEWLYEHVAVDKRWCLVHATHLTAEETHRIATSGAVAGLCPSTEANLGDGLFSATEYVAAGGRFGIGSDSHVSLSVAEELRWLEYGQRLNAQRRNRLATSESPSVGRFLFEQALRGGGQALGQSAGRIAVGARADFVILDGEHPFVATSHGDALIDRWLFAGSNALVRDVYVGGKKVIEAGQHAQEQQISSAFRHTLHALH